jgi:tetratricopeptide (TPR) repeat protein
MIKINKEQLSNRGAYAVVFPILVLCCFSFLVYSNTLYSSFHLDDIDSILVNPSIKNLSNLKAIWNFWPTRFITYLSVALNYHFSHLRVFAYHLFNLTVHTLSAVLVWWLVLLTFSTPLVKGQKIARHASHIAFFVSLVFLSHPIQTQAVTYIIQRATSLASLFYLASLSLYVKSRLLQLERQSSGVGRFYYIASFVAAVMAMFTKEMTITLPFMILLYEACFLKAKKSINWKQLIPFLITLFIIPMTMLLTKSVNFSELRRTTETGSGISIQHYLFTQFRVIITYLRLLFLPLRQNVDYDYYLSKSLLELPTLVSFLFLILILIIAIRISSRYRLLSFSIFWFFLTLLPESSVIPIRDVIFEHRLYLPLVGYSLFLVSMIYYLFLNNANRSISPILFFIITCYSILAYNRNFVWKDDFTLWDDAVRKSAHKARPYNSRGLCYAIKGSLDQAMADYSRAIEIDPLFVEAYNNRGLVYQNKGSFNKAIDEYKKALTINPTFFKAYNNRGVAYQERGSLEQALADYNKAIAINPNYADAYYNRGLVYQSKDDFNQALADYNKAIAINPDYANVYNNRGNIYYSKGNLKQALDDYTKAIELNPNFALAYNNRGVIYFLKQEYNKSWRDVHKAEALGSKINPNFLKELKEASARKN